MGRGSRVNAGDVHTAFDASGKYFSWPPEPGYHSIRVAPSYTPTKRLISFLALFFGGGHDHVKESGFGSTNECWKS